MYLNLSEGESVTGGRKTVGTTTYPDRSHESDLLHLTGSTIENVVFDRIPFKTDLEGVLDDFDAYVERIRTRIAQSKSGESG